MPAVVKKNTMKIVLQGELEGEAEFNLPSVLVQELRTLVTMAQFKSKIDTNPASVAGILISLGIDVALGEYARHQLRARKEEIASLLAREAK
ncbi:MAG: hypothetical protein XU15_C0011G0085 [candidate division NC10 bacterium CSP1-5]|nr:MAG: hypothetical protein XU15_C0011G0085 [candidate division NC10 bacterium CSP1-5]